MMSFSPHGRYSPFSRMASKMRNAAEMSEADIRAAQLKRGFSDVSQDILSDVQLQHPVAYDNLNLCDMCKRGTMKTFSLRLFASILVCQQKDSTQGTRPSTSLH